MEGVTTDWFFEFRVKHESVVWMNMSENLSVTWTSEASTLEMI